MEWKTPTEQAAIGFVGYGALSLALSPSILHLSLSSLAGALVGFGYGYFGPFQWGLCLKLIFPGADKAACVSVTPNLRFSEVSNKAPVGSGFIRISGVDKMELFEKLNGKAINHDTIPFHMKVILEEGRPLEVPWSAIEPHLKAVV